MTKLWQKCGIPTASPCLPLFFILLIPNILGDFIFPIKYEYILVIDAGSSGSRIHVYKYHWDRMDALYPAMNLPDKKYKISPGLSSFESNPKGAGSSLKGLVTFAEEQIPVEAHNSTLVVLSATAGLRLLPRDVSEEILESCYEWLAHFSPFNVRRELISIISGAEEGAYGWLSVNFLHGRLPFMPNADKGTLPCIEVGGASAQVSKF
mmetsp:Transcript_273/g.551  ORF Transcript_273/g.551 Transcript_273/m.551 type:complete len:208 (+) Transcript_273:178-801(+)